MYRRILLLGLLALVAGACQGTGAKAPKVNPDLNKAFRDPNLDVQKYLDRFETEDREIFVQRGRIAETVGLEPGMTVADIGAGTGLFVEPFSRAVGPEGKVYAVEIAPRFLEHIGALAEEKNLGNVLPVLCTDDSVELPANSIDVAFICDTYHHFEYPESTMTSLLRALRPGGRVVIIDFHRIEGESAKWILDHMRAGQDVFRAEIEAVGFRPVADPGDVDFLEQNYIMKFEKR